MITFGKKAKIRRKTGFKMIIFDDNFSKYNSKKTIKHI